MCRSFNGEGRQETNGNRNAPRVAPLINGLLGLGMYIQQRKFAITKTNVSSNVRCVEFVGKGGDGERRRAASERAAPISMCRFAQAPCVYKYDLMFDRLLET